MARIKIVLSDALVDGMDVKFKAPCNCTEIEGLTVRYPTEDDGTNVKEFSFRDAHGKDLTGIGNLFSKDAYVKVVLDTVNGYAYIQNADNNSYLHSAVLGTYTESSAGLIGSGVNGKFKAGSSGSYSTITVNGSEYSVRCGGESSIDLIAGCWYTFILDGNTINFNSGGAGGGLSFKVVGGTTAPASPKENDIWVNTDTEITGWHFGTEDIFGQLDLTNSVNATNVVSGLSNGEIHFKNDLSPMWSSTYIAKIRLFAGVKYVLSANLGYGRFSLTRFPEDDQDSMSDFVEGLACGSILTFEKNRVEFTSLVTADYYVKFCSDHTGANGAKPAFSTGILLYPKSVNVWISTGTQSGVAFNALKKNGLMVYPLKASQYINGAWVEKTAKSYQGGAWVDWWNGQLYEYGNAYESITGGFSTYGSGATLTENADHLLIISQGNSGVYTNNPVDMTKYKTLTFDWTCMRGGIDTHFQVRSEKSSGTSGWAVGTKIVGPSAIRQTTTLDISSLSGSYYIGIGRFSSGGPNESKIHSIIMT